MVPYDTENLDSITDQNEKKKKTKLRELNEDAYEDLILSIKGETEVERVVFQTVCGAKTNELADGDSREAWDRLSVKFKAKTEPFCFLLKSKIVVLKLKYKHDPEIFISMLEGFVLQYNQSGVKKSNEDTLKHVCRNLPSIYEVVIHPSKKRIG